jgi:hypothetical protein
LFAVTRTAPSASTVAAISMSCAPIGRPRSVEPGAQPRIDAVGRGGERQHRQALEDPLD